MIVYEFILSIDRDLLQELHNKKLVRLSVLRDIEMYDFYMDECQDYRKLQARTNTAKKFGVSVETVSKTLQRLNNSLG